MTEGDRPADCVNPRIAPGANDDLGADASRIAEGDREERFLCGVGHAAGSVRVWGSGFRREEISDMAAFAKAPTAVAI